MSYRVHKENKENKKNFAMLLKIVLSTLLRRHGQK